MGEDKAQVVYAGEPQIVRAHRVLAAVCARVFVSVRPDQAHNPAYAGYELVIDNPDDTGPAAGLLAAWHRAPGAALLAVAVDLPLVDAPLLESLLASRDRLVIATAFEHADGTLEPLCTIWEPAARAILRARAQISPASLRRVLEEAQIRGIRPPDPARLRSINTPEDYARLRSRLDL
jgi:molybdopterin-guanine dinucleotide biosynthesis protein A